MDVPRETIEHLARLARIGLTPEEAQRLGRDLAEILDHVENLPEPEPGSKEEGEGSIPWVRDDEPLAGLHPRRATAHAPRAEGAFFTVPRTVEKQGS